MLTLGKKTLSVPILQGGMGVGVSLGGLAGAVAACGGMGCISTADAGYREPDFARDPAAANHRALTAEIQKAKAIAGGMGLVAINAMVATRDYVEAIRTAVAAHLNRTFGLPYAQKDIFPTTGAAGAIAHAVRAVTRPGDEVLTFAPYFPEYGPYVEGTGAHLRVVPPQAPAFQPNLEAFEQMLTEKVTCVLINTPNNPTGVVYSADTLTRLAEILTEKSRAYGHNIFLVSDEPYRDIAFDGRAVPYPAAFYPHTLTCFSFSKSLSLPGERLGYVAVRPGCEGEEVLVDMMAQISRFTGHNCPPSIIQRAVSRCLDVTSDLSVYETNMDLLYNKLKALGFEVERPGGTFYLFPKALEEDANAFCRRAREFDLLLVPSDTFGVTGYVRLAYCIDTEKVKRSLPALEKLAAAYQ